MSKLRKQVVAFVENHSVLTHRLDKKEKDHHDEHVGKIADALVNYIQNARDKGEAGLALAYVTEVANLAGLNAVQTLSVIDELHHEIPGNQLERESARRAKKHVSRRER
jgi:hypothetical protein